MKLLVVLIFLCITSGCAKEIPHVIDAPKNPIELNTRLLELSKIIPFLDYTKLPQPLAYSESGITDLVFLSEGLRSRFLKEREILKNDIDIKISVSKVCSFIRCPWKYRFERRINSFVYNESTHYVEYNSKGELVLTLNVRYSPYFSQFHIIGYYTPIK